MQKQKIIRATRLLIMLFIAVMGLSSLKAENSTGNEDAVIFWNGTGEEISELTIISDDKQEYLIELSLKDKQAVGIGLPNEMKESKNFMIVVKYGKKTAKSPKMLNRFNNNDNTVSQFVLSLKGKKTSLPMIQGKNGLQSTTDLQKTSSSIEAGTIIFDTALDGAEKGRIIDLILNPYLDGYQGSRIGFIVGSFIGAGKSAYRNLTAKGNLIVTPVN